MSRPARFLAVLLATFAPLAFSTAELSAQVVRVAPTRPARFSVTTIDKVAYYNLADLAKYLELKGAWSDGKKVYTLTGRGPKLEFDLEGDGRKLLIDGLWVHLGNKVITRGSNVFLSVTDYERTLRGILSPRDAGVLPPVPQVIVIDPGHGEWDPGFTGNGLTEKVLTLEVAKLLQRQLEGKGYRAVLTRTEDKALAPDKDRDLPARSALATAVGADLFISIHFNSVSPNETPSGTEIYAYTPAGQRSTKSWSTPLDNDAKPDSVPVNQHDSWSSLLSHTLQQQLVSSLKTRDRGQKTAHFVVLSGLDCPGVLIESAFISNPAEARKLATPEFRDQIAGAIVAGIEAYAKSIKALRAAQ